MLDLTNIFRDKSIASAWDLTVPVRGQMYLAIALAVLDSLTNLISLIFIPLIARDIHNPDLVWRWVIGMGISVAVSLLARIWAFRTSHLAAYKLEDILRTILTTHLAAVPLGYTQTLGSGAVKKIVQDDVRMLHGFVADSVPLFGRAYTTPIVTLPLLFFIDWRMALASIATLPIGIGAMSLAMKDYAQKRQEYDTANENINTAVIEFVQGMQVIRTFDNGTSSFARYRKSLDIFTRIGSILAEPELSQPTNPQVPKDASIAFKDVSFGYGSDRQVLRNINFDLPADTVTALVGLSGAGKTTLVRLIPRFWDVSTGSIEIGGVDVRAMTTDTLMSWVSFVFQDTFLTNDTIQTNISLGKPGATIAEIEAAAKAACAHDFILNLPNGYSTIVGERGARLSGGERQRITIARAILQNNPIVIIDEATAFADPENELLIQQAIAALTQHKTLIVIAHRLATIQNADRIIVLDVGGIAEQGKHAELLALNGLYARLWTTAQTARDWQLADRSRDAIAIS